jgi:hypothetical protein
LCCAEVFGFVLGVKIEEENAVVGGEPVVAHPSAAAFAVAFGGPAELSAAARSGDHVSRIRLRHQIDLDLENALVPDKLEGFFGEFWIFLKGHGGIIGGIPIRAR